MTKSTILALIMLGSFCGCAHQYGIALVNKSGNDLTDVQIISGNPNTDKETYHTSASLLPADGYMRVYPVSQEFRDESAVQWKTQAGGLHKQIVRIAVPPRFSGYVTFEFTDQGVRVIKDDLPK